MTIEHEEEKEKGAFFVEENSDRVAELLYFSSGPDEITVYHTEVDEKLRDQHVGDRLVAAVVKFARENGRKIVPTCSFAKKVIDRTPEFQDVLA
ncbi:hypothetical protein BH10ACI3_BH10ACI3_29560 [soil metagenome]